MGWPLIRIAPLSGCTIPPRMLINVDFPAPFSPNKACTSPDWRSKLTPESARVAPNLFFMFLISRSISLMALFSSYLRSRMPFSSRNLNPRLLPLSGILLRHLFSDEVRGQIGRFVDIVSPLAGVVADIGFGNFAASGGDRGSFEEVQALLECDFSLFYWHLGAIGGHS